MAEMFRKANGCSRGRDCSNSTRRGGFTAAQILLANFNTDSHFALSLAPYA